MATDHSTNGQSPTTDLHKRRAQAARTIFDEDNPEDVCKINPMIDKKPFETFSRIEGILAMVQDIEMWRNDRNVDSAHFSMLGCYGFHSALDAARGALNKQVDILYERACKIAEESNHG